MFRIAKTVTALTASAAVAVPAILFTATGAHADDQEREREFRCHGAEVDFQVEKDDRRFEIDVDVDDARKGSKWRVKLSHDGKVFHNRVHRADSDGEFDIERTRRDTSGRDAFSVVIKPVGKKKACKTTLVLR